MLIKRSKLKNIFSYGPDAQDLELKPLNVLIGPNDSGKSIIVEAIRLLQSAPNSLVRDYFLGPIAGPSLVAQCISGS